MTCAEDTLACLVPHSEQWSSKGGQRGVQLPDATHPHHVLFTQGKGGSRLIELFRLLHRRYGKRAETGRDALDLVGISIEKVVEGGQGCQNREPFATPASARCLHQFQYRTVVSVPIFSAAAFCRLLGQSRALRISRVPAMEIPCVLQDAADSGIDLSSGKQKGLMKLLPDHKVAWRSAEGKPPGQFTVKLARIQGTADDFSRSCVFPYLWTHLQAL